MHSIKRISAALLAMSLAVSAAACSSKDDYVTPVNQVMTAIQEEEPERFMEAFGTAYFQEACEEYFEDNEEFLEDICSDGEALAAAVASYRTEQLHDLYDDFTYEIKDEDVMDNDDIEELEEELALIEDLSIDEAYRVELKFDADKDMEELLEAHLEKLYVGKVEGEWVLLNVEDVFGLLQSASVGGEDSYRAPVQKLFQGIQENDPELVIDALGGELLYDAYEETGYGADWTEPNLEHWTNGFYDDTFDGEFEYSIEEVKKYDEDYVEADILDKLHLVEDIDTEDVYYLQLEFRGTNGNDSDEEEIEEEMGEWFGELFVGYVDGRWILLNYEDMFDLY